MKAFGKLCKHQQEKCSFLESICSNRRHFTSASTRHQCVVNPLWAETWTQGTVQCQLNLQQISLWILILDKHSPVEGKKYAAVLSVFIKEFENRL